MLHTTAEAMLVPLQLPSWPVRNGHQASTACLSTLGGFLKLWQGIWKYFSEMQPRWRLLVMNRARYSGFLQTGLGWSLSASVSQTLHWSWFVKLWDWEVISTLGDCQC